MRPCDKCGTPVSNSARLCAACVRLDGSNEEANPTMASESSQNHGRSETAYVLSILLFHGLGSLIVGSVFGLLVFGILLVAIGLSISTSATIAVAIGCCISTLILFAALTQGN